VQIYGGALTGLLIAFAIGAAFLAVFYTQTNDLYGRSEELWEGIFNLIAVALITPMSLAILRADRSRTKWRKKLSKAFAGLHSSKEGIKSIAHIHAHHHQDESTDTGSTTAEGSSDDRLSASGSNDIAPASPDEKSAEQRMEKEPISPSEGEATHVLKSDAAPADNGLSSDGAQGVFRTLWTVIKRPFTGDAKGATAIFIIPMITTLREGLEGVVFIGGVSLGLPATSIPLPAIVGLFCGLLCGYVVFKAGSFSKVRM
jgi:high-affinity iron transporter